MADPHHPAAAEADTRAYQHGQMPIAEHVETFHLFMRLAKWGSLMIACSLLLLVMWFRPHGNLIGGLIAAVMVAVVGYFALKSKAGAH